MWNEQSPMWWHRSAGHRAAVVVLVVFFYLLLGPLLAVLPLALLAVLGG
jgi:hypothetical protein